MADATGHPSRIAGLTEGAAGKLAERQILDVASLSAVLPGNPASKGIRRCAPSAPFWSLAPSR
jgi:hypothetical protein